MFIQTTQQTAPNIKVFRLKNITPDKIWLRLGDDTLVSLSLPEAQEVVAGLTLELQVELDAAKQVQS